MKHRANQNKPGLGRINTEITGNPWEVQQYFCVF